jgi:2-polyprenyl-3-methyl-5-hydroxy-6-metoxy-1,4-benzoquinol methylase
MFRIKCLICNSASLESILDMGMHPLADSFIPRERESLPDKCYPLEVQICHDCGNIQLRCITSPEERYQDIEYSYTSSHSEFSRRYWEGYADYAIGLCGPRSGALKILEIGSNDGYLLGILKEKGHIVQGIDASPAACESAKKRGIDVNCSIFSDQVAKELCNGLSGKYDLIIANNVFNHANEPLDFALGVNRLLADKGRFVFESPYWLSTLKSGHFDQIYHEHVTYPTARSISTLMKESGFSVFDVETSDYHGGSLRVVAEKKSNGVAHGKLSLMIDTEMQEGIFNVDYYGNYFKKITQERDGFLQRLYEIRANEPDVPIVCMGAAAKANTFINFYRLDRSTIRYVTDVSPTKIGKVTPLSRIPIASDEVLRDMSQPYAIITSWNLAEIIRKKLLPINSNIRFISPNEH